MTPSWQWRWQPHSGAGGVGLAYHRAAALPVTPTRARRHPPVVRAWPPPAGVHIRLMVTRGLKPTPYQNPNITIGKPTIVIIPEYKVRGQPPSGGAANVTAQPGRASG